MTTRLTTLQAAQRAWAIRRLYQEGAVDRGAAVLSLDAMAAHDNPRIAGLVRSIVQVGMERAIAPSTALAGGSACSEAKAREPAPCHGGIDA